MSGHLLVNALIHSYHSQCFILFLFFVLENNIRMVKSGQGKKIKKIKKGMTKKEVEREERIQNVVSNCGTGYSDAEDYLAALADATKKIT